jgi:hypothetical protein
MLSNLSGLKEGRNRGKKDMSSGLWQKNGDIIS